MAEVLVIGKKISEMGLVNEITGEEKIPTSALGDKAVTTGQLLTYVNNNGVAQWGRIGGDITDQVDLQNQFTQERNTLKSYTQEQVSQQQAALQEHIDATNEVFKYARDNGSALPYKEGITYEENAVVVKDGVIQQWKGGVWRSAVVDGLSDTIQTFNIPEAGVDPVTGVASGAYFNVRSESDESYADEYQNVGSNAVATGKSYLSALGVQLQEKPASTIKDASGKSQEDVNKIKGLNIWDFFTTEEISSYNANPTTFDMTVALQRGIGAATLLNRKIEGYGEFYIADTLVISCACDLLDVQLNTDVTNKSAVQVRMPDYAYMWRKELKLPKVSYKNHVTQDGWPDNAVGIEIINTLSCEIEVPHVRGFHTNLKVTSTLSNCYNNFYLGQLDNGKINLDVTTSPLTESARPWTNENNFFGGRYSHNGGEGTNVAGVRHIRLYAETSTLNNNVFYKPSIEASVSEYNLELACQYCKFIQPRFESDPPKVLYRKNNALSIADAQAQYNVIDGGYNSDRIVFTREGTGAFRNRLIAPNRELNTLSSTSGGNRYVNLSGRTHAVLSLFQPEVDIDTADFSQYSLMLSSAGLRGKRATDTSDRVFVDVYNGAITFTDGAGSTPTGISRNAVGLNITGVLHSITSGTDLGTNGYRFGRLFLSGGVGCYGATPPATKPSITGNKTPATIEEQNAVMDSIVAALVAFGLASDDRV